MDQERGLGQERERLRLFSAIGLALNSAIPPELDGESPVALMFQHCS